MKPYKVKLLKGNKITYVLTHARTAIAACVKASRRYKLPHCGEAVEVA